LPSFIIELRSVLQFGYRKRTELEPDLQKAQESILQADLLVWIYPVWWGSVPALMMGDIDRVLCTVLLSKESFREKWLVKIQKFGKKDA